MINEPWIKCLFVSFVLLCLVDCLTVENCLDTLLLAEFNRKVFLFRYDHYWFERTNPRRSPFPIHFCLFSTFRKFRTMVFILDGCSFDYAHTWSKSGFSIYWRHLVTSKESSNPIFFGKEPILLHTCTTFLSFHLIKGPCIARFIYILAFSYLIYLSFDHLCR